MNRDRLKDKLVANAYGAYKIELPVENTDAQTEKEEVNEEYKSKLILEGGMVHLPDPRQLNEGWLNTLLNIPDTTYENVI